MPTNHKLTVENTQLMKALEMARHYVELDATSRKYPLAIETLAVIDAAMSGKSAPAEGDTNGDRNFEIMLRRVVRKARSGSDMEQVLSQSEDLLRRLGAAANVLRAAPSPS